MRVEKELLEIKDLERLFFGLADKTAGFSLFTGSLSLSIFKGEPTAVTPELIDRALGTTINSMKRLGMPECTRIACQLVYIGDDELGTPGISPKDVVAAVDGDKALDPAAVNGAMERFCAAAVEKTVRVIQDMEDKMRSPIFAATFLHYPHRENGKFTVHELHTHTLIFNMLSGANTPGGFTELKDIPRNE